jgi:hypothetical protein
MKIIILYLQNQNYKTVTLFAETILFASNCYSLKTNYLKSFHNFNYV